MKIRTKPFSPKKRLFAKQNKNIIIYSISHIYTTMEVFRLGKRNFLHVNHIIMIS